MQFLKHVSDPSIMTSAAQKEYVDHFKGVAGRKFRGAYTHFWGAVLRKLGEQESVLEPLLEPLQNLLTSFVWCVLPAAAELAKAVCASTCVQAPACRLGKPEAMLEPLLEPLQNLLTSLVWCVSGRFSVACEHSMDAGAPGCKLGEQESMLESLWELLCSFDSWADLLCPCSSPVRSLRIVATLTVGQVAGGLAHVLQQRSAASNNKQ